jgi:ribonuclease HI
MTTSNLILFTDGACSGNPGPGGWAYILIRELAGRFTVYEAGGAAADTTNNRMEMSAVGKALLALEKTPGDLKIYTDSKYVIDGATQWLDGWKKRGWKKSDGKEVANPAHWKRLDALLGHRKTLGEVQWFYVPGHQGVPGNERCDEIAVAFSKGRTPSLYEGSLEGYGIDVLKGTT